MFVLGVILATPVAKNNLFKPLTFSTRLYSVYNED